ncbi:hypothetical protein CMI38_01480 [Candidatus Pacearchaeota archaeon]|jgi:DNA-directed RNA polymerase subunit alpha|nr:hypothetical protein [Candidatus Pacearchaeota archaeon]|tara:strand:- start:1219 stop:1887 length:669 start_codon:yes stop_codon:yes gene_type:complete
MTDEVKNSYARTIIESYRDSITPLVGDGDLRKDLLDRLGDAFTSHDEVLYGKLDDVVRALETPVASLETENKEDERINYISFLKGVSTQLITRIKGRFEKYGVRTYSDLLDKVNEASDPYNNLDMDKLGAKSCEAIMAGLVEKGLYQPTKEDSRADMLKRPVTDLNLSRRSKKCMTRLGIGTIGELVGYDEIDLLETRNFGLTGLNEVRDKLGKRGLSLRAH